MVHELSKSFMRRCGDHRFATRWFVGDGIDVGSGDDPLGEVAPFFPLLRSIREWDRADGDAGRMEGVPDNAFDFVHSSHCLEHLDDPVVAFGHWIRICRPGGHLIITVPDEDLYEQGVFPSTFNAEHQWTFTISKSRSWSPKSISLFTLLGQFSDSVQVLKLELLDGGFRYGAPRRDQTLGPFSESAIELILCKRPKTPGQDAVVEVAEAKPAARPRARRRSGATVDKPHLLLHRDDAMGDVLMTTPVAARLRETFGREPVIHVRTNQLGVYVDNPHIDAVNAAAPAGGYQRTINLNLAYEMRPRMHAIDAYMLVAFGDADWPHKQVVMHKASITDLPDLPWDRAVALHTSRSSVSRTFPYSFWDDVIKRLLAAGLTPVTLGARDDLSWNDAEGIVDLTHRLSIQQIASVIERCRCFICGDTGLMQVAGSTPTPIVGLYTSVRPEYRMPFREGALGWRVTALTPDLDCVGCAADEPLPVTALSCRRGDFACVVTHRIKASAAVEATLRYVETR